MIFRTILLAGMSWPSCANVRDYWRIDGAHAAQNMILMAHNLGLGSVWLGTWSQMERVQKQSELFELPKYIMLHSILALGYPVEKNKESE